MTIEWKDVPGFEGNYQVSTDGQVKSLERQVPNKHTGFMTIHEKILKTKIRADAGGYLSVCLFKGGNRRYVDIQVLVLEAFVGPRPTGLQACHNDGNPTNNKLSNLRWDTPKANTGDKEKHGTDAKGVRNPRTSLSEEDVKTIRRLAHQGKSYDEIAIDFNLSYVSVSRIVNFRTFSNIDPEDDVPRPVHTREKLNTDVVRIIKKRLKAGESNISIARDLGIKPMTISRIKLKKRYATV